MSKFIKESFCYYLNPLRPPEKQKKGNMFDFLLV